MPTNAERIRIIATRIGIVGLVLLALGSDSVWKTEFAEHCFCGLAILLATIGCLGRVWCLAYIAGRKNQELVTQGPYSICRNPLYLFSVVGAVGVGMASCTFTLPIAVLIGFAGLHFGVVVAEESRLAAVHGNAYEEYRSVTPRFLPAFQRYHPAERLSVDVRRFQAGLFDASWFLLGILGTHLIAELHEAGYGVIFFRLV